MKEFTAELEQFFDVTPSAETGLLIDTFDSAGVHGGGATSVRSSTCWASVCRVQACGQFCACRATICGSRAATVPA
jgi:hypothetical protein